MDYRLFLQNLDNAANKTVKPTITTSKTATFTTVEQISDFDSGSDSEPEVYHTNIRNKSKYFNNNKFEEVKKQKLIMKTIVRRHDVFLLVKRTKSFQKLLM